MNRDKIRIGIAGQRGGDFITGLKAIASADLVAFCEIDEERLHRLADKYDVQGRFTRFEEMLDAVDAVVVATPMQWHAPQTIMALKAGKHVMSEVTAAVSMEECWRTIDAVQESRCTYMMAENYCYRRDNVLVKEMARKGMFGELYFGEGEYLHEVRFMHHFEDGSPTWRHYWQVGQNGSTYPTHSLGPRNAVVSGSRPR